MTVAPGRSTVPSLLAVVPVREAGLPLGADEVVAEAGGRVLLIGEGAASAARELAAAVGEAWSVEAGPFDPAAWPAGLGPLAPVAQADVLILPASPDGRDLAPRLAAATGRSLYCGVVSGIGPLLTMTRLGDRAAEDRPLEAPAVVTLVPGRRGVEPRPPDYRMPPVTAMELDRGTPPAPPRPGANPPGTVQVVEVSPPDPDTMDLAEAPFIVAGGMGLGDARNLELLGRVARLAGASLGATRVVTDAGWVPFERQIGTTGVAVNPRVYVAFGVSGAVQHTSGLGSPDHVVSVNLDASCPMMAMADLAVVADAPAVVAELAARLEKRTARTPAATPGNTGAAADSGG